MSITRRPLAITIMKRFLNIIRNIFTWLIGLIAIVMVFFTIISTRTVNQDDRDLLGYKAFIVKSDSMSKTDFEAGDLIVVKEIQPVTLNEGDIIAYKSTDPSHFNETITHKIRRLTVDEDGRHGFITYGTTTDVDDTKIVLYKQVLGKYQFRIPKVGYFFSFLKTTPGYITCILAPLLFIMFTQVLNCIKLIKIQRREQMEMEKRRRIDERNERKELMDDYFQFLDQLCEVYECSNDDLRITHEIDVTKENEFKSDGDEL